MLLCPTRRGWTVRPKCAGISDSFASSSAPWPCIVLFGISVSLFELCLVAFSENKISNKKPDTYSVSGETEFLGGDGIVTKGVENTIRNVGRVARNGMAETDREIIDIMISGK